jgi:hypothetical protein
MVEFHAAAFALPIPNPRWGFMFSLFTTSIFSGITAMRATTSFEGRWYHRSARAQARYIYDRQVNFQRVVDTTMLHCSVGGPLALQITLPNRGAGQMLLARRIASASPLDNNGAGSLEGQQRMPSRSDSSGFHPLTIWLLVDGDLSGVNRKPMIFTDPDGTPKSVRKNLRNPATSYKGN